MLIHLDRTVLWRGTIIISILEMKRLRHREIKWLTQRVSGVPKNQTQALGLHSVSLTIAWTASDTKQSTVCPHVPQRFHYLPRKKIGNILRTRFPDIRPKYAKVGLQSSWMSTGSPLMVFGFVSLALDGEVRHTAQLCRMHNACSVKASYMAEWVIPST